MALKGIVIDPGHGGELVNAGEGIGLDMVEQILGLQEMVLRKKIIH